MIPSEFLKSKKSPMESGIYWKLFWWGKLTDPSKNANVFAQSTGWMMTEFLSSVFVCLEIDRKLQTTLYNSGCECECVSQNMENMVFYAWKFACLEIITSFVSGTYNHGINGL